ncbi:hypothetical protein HMPREF0201_03817 [Cedecea davisae DSM 4568]|uniref:Uncharacterized protein n=1 Tax=Cedecea davisae DSM 4568 TaxID=566551 RepID=S3J164_9ENTR|nr:hypothetical protein HMPREF0201_03817 [Cedecea davisae DSM 4568]
MSAIKQNDFITEIQHCALISSRKIKIIPDNPGIIPRIFLKTTTQCCSLFF